MIVHFSLTVVAAIGAITGFGLGLVGMGTLIDASHPDSKKSQSQKKHQFGVTCLCVAAIVMTLSVGATALALQAHAQFEELNLLREKVQKPVQDEIVEF